MLTYDSASRISADEALQHNWIKKKVHDNADPKTTELALSNLKNFRVRYTNFIFMLLGRIKAVVSCNYIHCKSTCI